jgi:hypothetical protein
MLFWRPGGGAPIDNGATARAHDSVQDLREAQTVAFLAARGSGDLGPLS